MKRIAYNFAVVVGIVSATAASAESQGGTQPTFGLNHVEALQSTCGGYPLWQYVASVAWVALAFVIAPVIDFVMTRILKKLTEKTETDLDDKLLEILHKPVKVAVVLAFLNVGLHFFSGRHSWKRFWGRCSQSRWPSRLSTLQCGSWIC